MGRVTANAVSVKTFDGVQLSIDPVAEIENIDELLMRRTSGSRPGAARLLTRRRDLMRELAAQLEPRR